MLKLYKFTDREKLYWETWDVDSGRSIVHWGQLGTRGQTKTVVTVGSHSRHKIIQLEIDAITAKGFTPVKEEDHAILMIEYAIQGMESQADLDKRQRLEEKMNETLGWTGLGSCDGGSIGSGTMEVCNFVVDFETAKKVIENDLKNTEFSNFTRIYLEA